MAREDEDDALPPLGEDTVKFLEEAKKGKPRSFLLICKGVKLKYLLVKKKPVKKSEIADAKKLGYKGDAYIGVITGKGMDLVFNLSTADGYDSEPCKEKTLKDFLEEHAEFKAKPSFAIVASLPSIPFDDEDLSHPLVARFMGLAELIATVSGSQPNLVGTIESENQAILSLLQDGNFNEAEPQVNRFEAQLNAWMSGGSAPVASTADAPPVAPPAPPPPPVAPPAPPAPTQGEDPLKTKLQDALNKLVPQLKQAVATFPDRKVELLTPVATIKKQLESGELQEARTGILSVGQLLKSLLTSSQGEPVLPVPSETAQPGGLEAEYREKLAQLEPLYNDAIRQQLGDTSKFRAVMAYIQEQGSDGSFANAIKAIDRLLQAVTTAMASGVKETDSIPKGIVAERKKFLLSRWQQALASAIEEVQKLLGPIAEMVPGENPNELVAEIVVSIEGLSDRLNDAIFSAQTATDSNQSPLKQALAAVVQFKNDLANHKVVQLLDDAKSALGVDIKVREVLQDALNDLEAKLAN